MNARLSILHPVIPAHAGIQWLLVPVPGQATPHRGPARLLTKSTPAIPSPLAGEGSSQVGFVRRTACFFSLDSGVRRNDVLKGWLE